MRQLKIWNDSIIFFVSLFFATFCNYLTEAETQWSYTGENGPSNWGEMCAVGTAQVGIFYEFDWLNWLRLWILSKAETPLCSSWQNNYDFLKFQMNFYVDFIPFFVFRFGQRSYENTKLVGNLLFILQGKTG